VPQTQRSRRAREQVWVQPLHAEGGRAQLLALACSSTVARALLRKRVVLLESQISSTPRLATRSTKERKICCRSCYAWWPPNTTGHCLLPLPSRRDLCNQRVSMYLYRNYISEIYPALSCASDEQCYFKHIVSVQGYQKITLVDDPWIVCLVLITDQVIPG
jgi:hypothetical protein